MKGYNREDAVRIRAGGNIPSGKEIRWRLVYVPGKGSTRRVGIIWKLAAGA
jgi:hypothetical protein